MRMLCVAIALCIAGCCPPKDTRTQSVSVEYIRVEYAKSIIDTMDATQKWGDAENALSGGVKLFDRAMEKAEDVFPDGEYIVPVGISRLVYVEGYEMRGMVHLLGWKHEVFRKLDSNVGEKK